MIFKILLWLPKCASCPCLVLSSSLPFGSFLVGGEQISAIGRGICVLLGISLEDTQKELEHMVRKILNLRVFEDESGKHWSKSVMDKQYEILCVSQFTLQCVLKGNKPDFHLAMPTEQAEGFYNSFLEQLRKTYRPELIKDGKFGAYMQVHIQNDGPVTIELESPAPGTATSDPKQVSLESGAWLHPLGACNIFSPWNSPWSEEMHNCCNLVFILIPAFPRMHVYNALLSTVVGGYSTSPLPPPTFDSRGHVLCRARFFPWASLPLARCHGAHPPLGGSRAMALDWLVHPF
uniref:D-aminoacyl-tRNA deacylase n=1 Tax=Papio anubis TaxID=9555 RepID=A0A8I5N836_PAPAN